MKKIVFIMAAMMACPAMATDYGEYATYDYSDTYNCPVCECNCDNDARDNYTGVRLYKNEHTAYSYNLPNGHKEKQTADNFTFSTIVGNRLTDFARVEYETGYTGAKFNRHNTNSDYDIWFNMLNAYLFHQFGGAVEPYVGLGLGLTGIWGEIDGELDNAFDLSYQAMVGILFKLNSRIDLDVGFKYVNYGRVEHANAVSKVDATQFYIGASYKFGL